MSRRSDWIGLSGRGVVGLVLGLTFTAAIFAALTATLTAVPDVPVWAAIVPAVLTLAAVCAATLAATAWLTRRPIRQLAPRPEDLPPIRHAERFAADPRDWQTLTWHAPSADRPSAERPRPGLTWQCPVTPGKPRTVRDLREGPPRNLRSWE